MKSLRPSPDSSAVEFERKFVRPKEGRTLIVGSRVYGDKEDRRFWYRSVVGVDMLPGPGVDVVADLEETSDLGMFDHVECMSVLEHSKRPWLLAANIEKMMNPGATLFCTVPFIWRIHAYPNDNFRVSPEGMRCLFQNIEWEQIMLACSDGLVDGPKIRTIRQDNHPFFIRTETVGFGRRK